MDTAHPSHQLLTSTFDVVRDWASRAYDVCTHVAGGTPPTEELLYLSITLLSGVLLLCVLFKFFRGSSVTAIASSRTISISEIDKLMMKHSCGCDCSPVTEISNVTVAPSPELSFDASQPQLKLDTCDAVGRCCLCFFPLHLEFSPSHHDALQLQPVALAACYMREFLAKSHPLVNRSGPVCP
jgi:hypothetical protein